MSLGQGTMPPASNAVFGVLDVGDPSGDSASRHGYLQISLSNDGTIQVRGTRHLFDWFLQRLAADGWRVDFDEIHWCG